MLKKAETAIICSAGKGSRLGHNIPKPLVEVCGKSLIEWQLKALEGIRNVIVVVGYKKEYVIDEILSHRDSVTIVVNRNWETTNTAYSLSLACELVEGPVLTIDGDTIFDRAQIEKIIRHEKVIGVTKPMSEEGVFVKIHKDKTVEEFTRLVNTGYEWTGMSVMPSHIYRGRQNCFVYQIIEKNFPVFTEFIDLVEIDTPSDLNYAAKWINKLSKSK
ncbi:MAG: NTP transferase domain-containing protein [Patescibacteria group bacterium]|jgi:choline kinase